MNFILGWPIFRGYVSVLFIPKGLIAFDVAVVGSHLILTSRILEMNKKQSTAVIFEVKRNRK